MAAPPPVLTLAVEKGPREGETRQCRAGATFRVGRVVKGNDLALRDAGTSQQHLAVEFLPPPAGQWAVSDLGSSNGTFLNGAPLVPSVPTPLSHGDLIKVGESTVLAVSIAPDSDLNSSAGLGPRRSSRQAATAVEEKPPAATRRGARRKAAEPPDAEKVEPDAAAAVVEEEEQPRVTRGRGRKKAAAAEPPEAEKESMEVAAISTRRGRSKKAAEPPEAIEVAAIATRRGRPKKAAEPREPEKEEEEEVAVVMGRGGCKKAVEPPQPEKEEEKEVVVVTRGRGRRKAAGPSEPEKEEEEVPVAPRRSGRKKDAAVTPPPLPPKTRSGRGQGRVKWANSFLEEDEEEEQGGNDLASSREATGNPPSTPAEEGGEKEKGNKLAAGVEEVQGTAKPLEEELPVGEEEKGGGEEEEDGKREVVKNGGEVGDGEEVEQRAGRSSVETMTLREWFERMEKYLPRMINEAADQMIADLEERHRRIDEYISTLGNSSDPS